MTPTDPNADLIGFRFQTEQGPGEVTGTTGWSDSYVHVYIAGAGVTARQAKQVRRRKELG